MHGKSFWFIQTEKYLVRVTYSGTVQRGGGEEILYVDGQVYKPMTTIRLVQRLNYSFPKLFELF